MEDTYTITGGPLKPHEYVIIKREMTAADEAAIQNSSARVGGDKKNPQMELTIGNVDLALLKRMIVSWNLTRTGDTGQQEPIVKSDEEIGKLPRKVFKYIKAVINDLNPEDEEDYSAFLPSAKSSFETNSTKTSSPSENL
jgi:hypothetical protein